MLEHLIVEKNENLRLSVVPLVAAAFARTASELVAIS